MSRRPAHGDRMPEPPQPAGGAVRRAASARRRTPSPRDAGRRGLTLVEALLAITLAAGLMLAVLIFYDHVVGTRDEFTGQMTQVAITAARRAAMARMTDELRAAITYPFLQVGLSGQVGQMEFITTGVPGKVAWAVESISREPVEPEQDLRLVGYRIRYVENEDGDLVAEGLERTVQKVIAVRVAEEGEEIIGAVIAPEFKFLALRYWDNEAGEWLESWEGGDLPMAVEIVLGIEPLPEDMEPADYPYETFRRVVHVPGGQRAFGGSVIIRGGREGGL
jgi:hypothetical protein